jgi:hypothetical protein
MLTPGFRLYFGIALFGLFGSLVYGVNTVLQTVGPTVKDNLDQQGVVSVISGPVTVGWKGAVGNHMGYSVWLTMAVVAAFLAFLLVAFRDADPEAVAEVAQTETVPLTRAPSGPSYMPVVGAFALAVVALGWIVNVVVFYAGLALLAAVIGTWTIRAWADRATGDDGINRQIYHRIIDPIRVPIVGAFLVAFLVLGLSRVLLAVPNKASSSVIFGVAALIFFAIVVGIAMVPRMSKPLITILLVIGGLAVLGGGIYGIAAGPREMEHHGATTEGHGSEGTGATTGDDHAPAESETNE